MATIIDIDHEANDFSEYDSYINDADLTIAAGAALAGSSYGMSVAINPQGDTTVLYGLIGNKNITTGIHRVRYYVDPNSLTMVTNDLFTVFRVANTSNVLKKILSL